MHQYYYIWGKLAKKIETTLAMGKLRSNLLLKNSSDAYDSMRDIAKQVKSCFCEVEKFNNDYGHFLSEAALSIFETFLKDNKSTFSNIDNHGNMGGMGKDSRDQLIIAALIRIGCFESNITYLFNDTQENIRKSVEIAFAHLKRLIVADELERSKWQKAWNEKAREESFETYGGIHLLRHKIWAFKAHAEKERTDLILQEPISIQDPLYRSAEGLVLTEWKIVKEEKDIHRTITQAKDQASQYRVGSLAPLELHHYCYLVMVSKNALVIEDPDIHENNTMFRVINIPCFPKTPSGKKI